MTDISTLTEDSFHEEKCTRKSARPKAYKDLDDSQYRRCILREKLISASFAPTEQLTPFLEENRDAIFRAGFSVNEMESIGRTIRHNRKNYNNTLEESGLITQIFGMDKKAYPHYENCASIKPDRIRTPKQEIEYRKDCTFETFYDWVMGRGLYSIKDKLDDDDWDRLDYIVDDVCMRDIGLPRQKHYEDGDEKMLRARIKELKA